MYLTTFVLQEEEDCDCDPSPPRPPITIVNVRETISSVEADWSDQTTAQKNIFRQERETAEVFARKRWYWCEHCQCYHAAELPKDVAQAGLFGPKLVSLVACLKGRGHLSYKTLRDFFADALSLKVSTGFLAKQVRNVTDAMKKPYEELLKRLPNEPHTHIDETGSKENGEKRWAWCFRTGAFTVFHINPSRGSVVLENLLGLDYAGTIPESIRRLVLEHLAGNPRSVFEGRCRR